MSCPPSLVNAEAGATPILSNPRRWASSLISSVKVFAIGTHFKAVCAARLQSVCSDMIEVLTMKCPVCKIEELDFSSLENNLIARHCDKCGGNWIPSFEYWKWREQHKSEVMDTSAEQPTPPNPVPSSA